MVNNFNVPVLFKLADITAIEAFAVHIAKILKPGDVIGLSGNLGIGKTVLARSIIRVLATTYEISVPDIPSPTFSLVQQYDFPPFSIFHIDLYRIDDAKDTLELGIEDIFANDVSLIEWPERLGLYLPPNRLHLTLLPGDHDNDRIMRIDKFGSWRDRGLGSAIYV
ncbi:MAG: tRNA (adenosine(37)-N6)-threonylcarbamoyltransferase complex ATPase subunit type 1 TsaE [Rhodospirillaceae bacterium]|jgi:tRNA threonylcarbamoyladenosine biosynthesis protein TsaE|nr:tRNA (adenosine(37)-N6)-threonylcarbamoyltransferase complex ATPase subunit type 1 TsaE [Rhodospirillaceae bacterium]